MDKYEKLEKIGEGTYGKVYKGKERSSGRLVALKKTQIDDDEGIPSTAIREISILKNLSHSVYIVRLLDVKSHINTRGKQVLYMVFEYAETDLRKYLDTIRHSNSRISPEAVRSFMYQLCLGVEFCHSHGVLHRDLKPPNILVDPQTGFLKIADLGLGRCFTVPIKGYTQEVVTLWYRAPEVMLGTKRYSTALDIWSLGCIFAELCNLQPLFHGDCQIRQLLEIFKILGTPSEEEWPGVTMLSDWHIFPRWKRQDLSKLVKNLDPSGFDLLNKMLQYDPAKRISAREALSHCYFDSLDKPNFELKAATT